MSYSPAQLPSKIEEWTKEHVFQWLTDDLKVYSRFVDAVYEKGVSGAELFHFEKKHLLELGIKHGPAVKIMRELVKKRKSQSDQTQSQSVEAGVSSNSSNVKDHDISRKEQKRRAIKMTAKKMTAKKSSKTKKKSPPDTRNAGSQDIDDEDQDETEEMASVQEACETYEAETSGPRKASMECPPEMSENTSKALLQSSSFYPFDKHHVNHFYTQHSILPPETGPGNLIDPVHEYKYLGRTDDIDTIKRKFNNEVFRFAAGCMNSRTNGTIHCGVADDSKEMQFCHGEIIGIEVEKRNVIIDHFNNGFKAYFGEMAEDAKMCIRQPRFVEVLCSELTSSNRYVIEVDIVPSHNVTHGKDYFIQPLCEEKGWKKGQDSLYVRDGASTKDIMKIGNPRDLKFALQKLNENMTVLDARREQIEKQPILKRDSNQGEMLKDLLTCGGDNLDYYDNFVIVTNRSHPDQLKHLQFLSKLKIFSVLDFDPDSEVKGLCKFYRESRHANLHFPAQYQDNTDIVIDNLNLCKQTSWVFCNGRQDLDSKPLNDSDWLRTRAKEVQDTVSFLCRPQVLQNGRCLVIFLLLSNVETMNDPVFETFISFYKNLEGVQNIVSIFTDENTFQKWKHFTECRCSIDITRQCIYELDLSEVNGTIMKMGPLNQTSARFLPSSGSSSVCLEQKDADMMTALDILCENECKNIYDESSEEFTKFKIRTEEEFYRGGKVKWWNFYFSDKPKAKSFIKRDKYDKLKTMIQTVRTKDPTSPCVMLKFFHHPGCGGTTLAMHVMWNLRKRFRCAILKDNTVATSEVALQVRHLMKFGKTDLSYQTPVLLLVDDSEETENTLELQNCIRRTVDENSSSPLVIILNCVRSQNPKARYKTSITESNYITTDLSKNEQDLFEEKLQELKEIHKKPENFYSFMIMKFNFSKEYTENVVSNTLKDLDVSSKQAQMLSFLALLNSFVDTSAISLSVCENFLGIKYMQISRETIEQRMEPYSTLLIRFKSEEDGSYTAIRILHQRIATQCLEELRKRYKISKREIVINLLHNDLFFKTEMGKDTLMNSIHSMLITRQQKKEGDEKSLFSPLIEQIQTEEDGQQIQKIFEIASPRFEKLAAIPQALARYLYLIEKDFTKAYSWANDAKNITENPYTVDTIGQVSKSELKYKLEMANKQVNAITPDDLEVYLDLANKATKAFQRAQDLAKTDEGPEFEDHIKRQRSYNISGYMGEIDTTIMVFEIMCGLPFFEENDQIKHKYMQSFLNGKIPIRSIPTDHCESNNRFADVLEKYAHFLTSLKSRVKEIFEFFEMYFTYLKERNVEKDKRSTSRKRISEHFEKYLSVFYPSKEERHSEQGSKPKLSLILEIQERKMFLEESKADSFSGLLQYLEDSKENKIEKITEWYTFIHNNSEIKTTKDKTNYILANIILYLTVPNSKFVKSCKDLTHLLKEILQDVGTQHAHPEPYYLCLLLLWPGENKIDPKITVYVDSIRKSSHKKLSHLFRKRNTIAHFYLGKSEGLKRLVPKSEFDKCFPNVRQRNALWQSGDIFKEDVIKARLLRVNGIIGNGEAYINYGKLKIPVRPAYLGGVRSGYSTEKVSFYIGFAIDGPLAYDIKY